MVPVVNSFLEVKVSFCLRSFPFFSKSALVARSFIKKTEKKFDGVCFMCLTRTLKSSTRSQAVSTSFSDPSASQLQLTSTYCFRSSRLAAQKIKRESLILFVSSSFFRFAHLFTRLGCPLSECIESAEIKRGRE